MTSEPLLAPTSIGDLIDRISILEIKARRIADAGKAANVGRELSALTLLRDAAGLETPEIAALARDLDGINETLWNVEDEIRALDRQGDFGARFVELARAVYTWNDRRSAIKRQINSVTGSVLSEEKSY